MRITTLFSQITLTLVLTACAATVQAKPVTTHFIQGVEAFKQGHFQQAIDAFLPIAESGVENGNLFYNLGDAYLKAGQLGQAIYWYERAIPFMPRNADLKFNLDYARSLQIDDQPGQDTILTRVLFFWKDILAARTIQYLALGSNVLLWLGLGFLTFCSSSWIKAMTTGAMLLVLLVTPTALFQLYHTTLAPQAIIVADTAPIRSGRSQDATELFVLHAGTRVDVQEQTENYTKIAFGKEMFGWIEQKNLGIL